MKITLDIDDKYNNRYSEHDLKMFVAVSLYEKGIMCTGELAQAVGMSRADFILEMGKYGEYGPDTLSLFLQEINLYGGNYKALTNPEAFALRRAPSLDEARNRILAARQEGMPHLGAESLQKNEHKAPALDLQKHRRRRGFHR